MKMLKLRRCYDIENWKAQFGEEHENSCGNSVTGIDGLRYCSLDIEKFGYAAFACGNWYDKANNSKQPNCKEIIIVSCGDCKQYEACQSELPFNITNHNVCSRFESNSVTACDLDQQLVFI